MELEKIRDRLDALSWQMLLILNERLMLVREVAAQKKTKGDGVIHAPSREAAIFDRTVDHCRVLGLDPDYVLEIVSLMIAHAKDAECDVLGVDTFLDTRPKKQEDLRANLLKLTAATAPNYSPDYCEGRGSDAVQSYLGREQQLLRESIDALPNRKVALDLGCATGKVAELLERYFCRVRGFDLCPQMIEHARTRRLWPDYVEFETTDLEERIPQDDASVSFAVANFGAASEVSQHLLPELSRVLEKGGKAFLSFYNADAISNLWYYPWPSTMRAHLNAYNNTLEVWYRDQVYTVQGTGMTVRMLQEACGLHGLEVEWVETYPTFLSIVPRFFFGSPRFRPLVKAVTEVDEAMARKEPYRGTHLTALIRK